MTSFKINCSTEYRTSWQSAEHHTLTSISTQKISDSQCISELGGKRISPPWGLMCCDSSDGRNFLATTKVLFYSIYHSAHFVCLSQNSIHSHDQKKKRKKKSHRRLWIRVQDIQKTWKCKSLLSIYGYFPE